MATATYTYNQLHGSGSNSANLEGTSEYTFTFTNPSSSAYFTMETTRNTSGSYDSTSPTNINGTLGTLVSVKSLITSSYIASVVVPKGGGAFNFTPNSDITGTTLKMRGTGYVGLVIDAAFTPSPLFYYDPATSYSGTGTTLTDLSGNNRNSTIAGSPAYTSGEGGYFTFSNDYILTPDLDQLITAGDESHTVEVWIYPTNNGVVASYLGQATVDSLYHFSAIEIVGGQIGYGLWNAGIVSAGTTGISFNQWHQVVLTYDNTTCRAYLDGQFVDSTNTPFDSPMDSGSTQFRIAFGALDSTDQGDGTYFNGRMGVIRMYNTALTATQVLQNFEADRDIYGI